MPAARSYHSRIDPPVPHWPGIGPSEDAVTRPVDPPSSAPASLGPTPARGSTTAASSAARHRLGALYRRTRDIALKPVYAFYVTRLEAAVMAHPRPAHVAVIMDGNRRWATEAGYEDPSMGHRRGAEKALELIDWCADLGIREVTLWALSIENLARGDEEVGVITDVAADAIAAMADGRRKTRLPIHLRVIGRRDLLPAGLAAVVERSAELSHDDGAMSVTVALAYSGRDELLEAFRATVREAVDAGTPPERLADSLTADALAGHLYTKGSSDPDLIIRTSGEVRLSGFLPWQSV
ncbi:MAG: short-chain Z-isoprenyl diphosphate synthase, partial [Chloroflexota bacterium]|nr:short-chain Z-isoprenyl diphosphate synthase [Chloroflexota bacterium]